MVGIASAINLSFITSHGILTKTAPNQLTILNQLNNYISG